MPLAARILFLVGAAVAPAIAVLGYNQHQNRIAREAEVKAAVERATTRAENEVGDLVAEVRRTTSIVARVPRVRRALQGEVSGPYCSELLTPLLRDYAPETEFDVLDLSGRFVCSSVPNPRWKSLLGPHVQRARDTNSFTVGSYAEDSASGARYLTFAMPVEDDAGRPLGAISVGLSLARLDQQVRPLVQGDHSVLSVHDRDLTFLARIPVAGDLIGKKPPPEVQKLSALANTGAMEAVGADGRTRIGAITSLKLEEQSPSPFDLSVAFGTSQDAAFAPIIASERLNAGLLAISVLLAAGAAWFGGRQFIRAPVERLLQAAQRWREGDYKARVEISNRGSELGRLAEAYEALADTLAQREQAKELLINELNHRVKNTLATVQSMAAQTVRSKSDPASTYQSFEARLLALSKAHNVLTRESWGYASLQDVINEAVAPFASGQNEPRFKVAGPLVWLNPGKVLSISMALHELCTNALKYGSLSTSTGQVHISWAQKREEGKSLVHLAWAETGGPPVVPPAARGFGSRLIERCVADQPNAEVRLLFRPEGVTCELLFSEA